MKKFLVASAIAIPFIIAFTFLQQDTTTVKTISTQETYELISNDKSIVLLDVRTAQEWNGSLGHLEGAMLIPVQELEENVQELEQYKEKTIIAYCRSGNRSGTATKFLASKGFNVLNMEGGMIKWNADQLPVIKEERK